MNVGFVSVEEFLQAAGMTLQEDSDAALIERFIAESKINARILGKIPRNVLQRYVYQLVEREPISYIHLMDEDVLMDRRKIDYSDIRNMMIMRIHDASVSCLVIDFEIGKAYISLHGAIVEDVCRAEKVIELSEGALGDVGAILNTAKVKEAEYLYQGDTSYRQGMVLAMELSGGIARFASVGINSGFPRMMYEACNYLMKCFYNM